MALADIRADILALGGFYLQLGEAAGATRVDSGPNGQDFADNNTVAQVAGKVGNGAGFTRASSHKLTRASAAANQFGAIDWTIFGWATWDYTAGAVVCAASKQGEFALYSVGSNLNIEVLNGAFAHAVDVTAYSLNETSLFHFAAGNRAASKTLWWSINANTKVVSSAYSTALSTSTNPWGIGVYNGSSHYFKGLLDEFGVIKRELTDTELDDLYNGGNGVNLYEVTAKPHYYYAQQ